DLAEVLDVRAVLRLLARLGREPGVEDLPELCLRGAAQAQREDVRVVPAARALRGRGVEAERRTDRGDLVRGDRGAGPGPAADDRLLGAALGDVALRGLARPGPVVALGLAQSPVRDRL